MGAVDEGMRTIALAAAAAALVVSSVAWASSISKDVLERPIRERMDEIRTCWDDASKDRDAPPTGKMVLRYHVDRDGKVARASVTENTTGDAKLARCVRDVFLRLEYPPQPAPISVVYPLVLALDD